MTISLTLLDGNFGFLGIQDVCRRSLITFCHHIEIFTNSDIGMSNQQTVIVVLGLTSVLAAIGIVWFLRKRQADENEDKKETDGHERVAEEDVFVASNEGNFHTAPEIDKSESPKIHEISESSFPNRALVDETVDLIENVVTLESSNQESRETSFASEGDSPPTREVQIIVPAHVVGIIIGKGGSSIKELRREFGVR